MKAIWVAKRFAWYMTSLQFRSNSKKIKRLKIHRWLLKYSSLTHALLPNVLKMTFMRIQKWLFKVHLMATMFVFLPMGRQALVKLIRWAGLRLSRVLWSEHFKAYSRARSGWREIIIFLLHFIAIWLSFIWIS